MRSAKKRNLFSALSKSPFTPTTAGSNCREICVRGEACLEIGGVCPSSRYDRLPLRRIEDLTRPGPAAPTESELPMHLKLKLHPDSRCKAVSSIEVDAARTEPGDLALRYVVQGAIGGVRLPPAGPQSRADELWRHTCFEAFVRTPDGEAYFELNVSPSAQWAAYAFDGYRRGMCAVDEIALSRFDSRSGGARYELAADFALGALANTRLLQLGLSAVIEESDGQKSYWALAHPAGKPDFHHSDCFAAELPAAWRA